MRRFLVPANKLVITTSNHGGYLGAECLLCGQLGWLDHKYGYPHGKAPMSNRLTHTEKCAFTRVLRFVKKGNCSTGTWVLP